MGAAIAQWIRLRLPSCCPGFESQAHHLCFFQFILFKLYFCHLNLNVKTTKINKKEVGIGPFLRKDLQIELDLYVKVAYVCGQSFRVVGSETKKIIALT